uniref:Uncharacterized protein n=1 Tax=Geospiza parvula TaxID=87175 RepID=A0A8C3MHZ6_GEOPR
MFWKMINVQTWISEAAGSPKPSRGDQGTSLVTAWTAWGSCRPKLSICRGKMKGLFSNWSDAEKRLEKCVEAKEELEADLYSRFVLVLNEKKAKIRNLQKLLSEAKESAVDAKCARDSIATTQVVVKRENNYDASTDEESENPARASLPSALDRRDSSLLGSPDIVDPAPRRKRRQRTAKPAGTGAKVAAYEAEQPAQENNSSLMVRHPLCDLSWWWWHPWRGR